MHANRCGSEQRGLLRVQHVQGWRSGSNTLEEKCPAKDKQAGVSKQGPCNVGRGKGREGGTKGMIGGMQVGFEVLGVAYG